MKSDLLDGFICSCGNCEPFLLERITSFELLGVTYWVIKCKKCHEIHTISWETTLKSFEPTINHIISIANKDFDGHFSIYKFTTHFKGSFGTVTGRVDLKKMPSFNTLDELYLHMITNRPKS
jgi:hypothetical protein